MIPTPLTNQVEILLPPNLYKEFLVIAIIISFKDETKKTKIIITKQDNTKEEEHTPNLWGESEIRCSRTVHISCHACSSIHKCKDWHFLVEIAPFSFLNASAVLVDCLFWLIAGIIYSNWYGTFSNVAIDCTCNQDRWMLVHDSRIIEILQF